MSNRFDFKLNLYRGRKVSVILSGPTPGTDAAIRGGVVDLSELPEPLRKVEYGYLSY